MKIENISSVPVDPVRIENSGVRSVVISQTSTNRVKTVEQPRKALQKDTRSSDEVHKDLEMINEQLKSSNSSIQFSIDDKTNDVIVRIVDKDSGEVIRQIPPESIVKLRDSMKDMSGLFVEKKV